MSYADYEWFLKRDLSDYAGKWVIIIDKKVVACGESVGALLAKVKKDYPNKRPFITKVRDRLSIETRRS